MGLFSEKENNIERSGACGRMTLNARGAFVSEKKNSIGRTGAWGRRTLNARYGAEPVDK